MNSHVSILYGTLDKHRFRKWLLMADLPQDGWEIISLLLSQPVWLAGHVFAG